MDQPGQDIKAIADSDLVPNDDIPIRPLSGAVVSDIVIFHKIVDTIPFESRYLLSNHLRDFAGCFLP
jgi:hypothetical protein